jgi:hypothetical protein
LTLACDTVAHSEADEFMRAVEFALTGSDHAEPKVIGHRGNCVFAIGNEVFRLNNVYVDRIKIQVSQKQWLGRLEQRVTVAVHSDDIVFETTLDPPHDDSELMRHMRVESPDLFKPQRLTYTEYELHLATNDQDRVKTAWQYVYSHGCTGKRSPS